jgi:hypothetical protein
MSRLFCSARAIALLSQRLHGNHGPKARCGLSALALLSVILLAPATQAFADDRDRLAAGLYVAAAVGCDGLGGAGTVDFDGENFSPHYQACLTEPLAQSGHYRQTCIEGQGSNYPTTAQIQGDPSKVVKETAISVLSRKSLTINGVRYDFCGAR